MAHYQDKLENLQKSIKKIQQHLKGNKKQRSHVLTELKRLELKISKNAIKLNALANKVQKSKQHRQRLEQEIARLNKRLTRQRQALSEQVRSAYSMGRQQNLKMLLNQQDPAQAGRVQEYFNYLNRARTEQITEFNQTIDKKSLAEIELKQTLVTQNELLQALKKKKRLKRKFQRSLIRKKEKKRYSISFIVFLVS